jgi:uncharacterized spore protein YtfJ
MVRTSGQTQIRLLIQGGGRGAGKVVELVALTGVKEKRIYILVIKPKGKPRRR